MKKSFILFFVLSTLLTGCSQKESKEPITAEPQPSAMSALVERSAEHQQIAGQQVLEERWRAEVSDTAKVWRYDFRLQSGEAVRIACDSLSSELRTMGYRETLHSGYHYKMADAERQQEIDIAPTLGQDDWLTVVIW